jgi:hypothetical protein
MQLILLGVPLVPIWVAGIVRLLRDPALRAIGLAYPLVCVLLLLIAGQPYYTMGLLLALYAAGCVPLEGWIDRAGSAPTEGPGARKTLGRRGRQVLVGAALALNMAVSALVALPLLPVPVLAKTPIPAINQTARDQIGWPAYVRQVAEAYRALPAADRAVAVIVTGNYGEAGALARYGGRYALPRVYSGQNELYHLGRPPDSATTAIIVGIDGPVESRFASCGTVARLDNGVGIDNEEQGRTVRVCRGPREPWSDLWPEFRHLD